MKTTDNEKKPSVNYSSTSTSSTDSGVIIIDNTTTINGKPVNARTSSVGGGNKERGGARQPPDGFGRTESRDGPNPPKINIQNYINITKADGNEQPEGPPEAQRFYGQQSTKTKPMAMPKAPKDSSPTPSRHSLSISIISIDEKAVDSSVVDSDSDFETDVEGDAEGEPEYIVKKVGTQTTLPPNSPEIPNLNKGLTVIREKVTPDGHLGGPNSLLKGAIGVPDGGLAPSTPQIGSIALTNSTDVTFGDKHFYEGPVTIQQFLIDSRDKWKPDDLDGQDNPIFAHDAPPQKPPANDLNGARKMTNDPAHQPYKFMFNRKAVVITGAIVVLTVLIGILFITIFKSTTRKSKLLGDGDDSRKNIPINSTIGADNIGSGKILRIVPRDAWLAQPASSDPVPLNLPIDRVVVIPTQTENCSTQAACTYRVRFIQTYNIESMQYNDIIYNFLIGGDGNVYEGRGWDSEGASLKGYNDFCISFAYIGTFKTQKPNSKQLDVTKLLLKEGVRLKKLSPDFQLVGANKIEPTSSWTSANALYDSFKDWPHWLA